MLANLPPGGAPVPPVARPTPRGRGQHAATVFGLDVSATPPLSLLERARAAPTGRPLQVRRLDREPAPRAWPADARTICVQRHRDGRPCFGIQAHPRAGYRIWGEGRGSYLLCSDGHRLSCILGPSPPQCWERFLVGQVLPFAALLSGLEILHASAVVLRGRATAFVGPSGAGKTSLALQMCRLGARFLADDVLALEPRSGALIAHPGTPVAALDQSEARRLLDAGSPPWRELLRADGREQLARVEGAAAAPIGSLFFLDRRAEGSGGPRFESAADARMLLASTFNFVLDTPQRMRGLLEVCALAARCRVERIVIPPSVDAGALATAVISRLDGAR